MDIWYVDPICVSVDPIYNGYIVGNAKTQDSDSQVAPCSWISGASSTMQNAVAQEDGRQPHWEQWQTTIVL